ncbi:cytochrome c5 family protein [Aquabacterium sp.]|uniref:c-type cytochrome n=1 Tax=Aquabacterium sp. TaxID=1872578 RepID=UPI0035B3BFF1
MSNAQHSHADSHEGATKTSTSLIGAVLLLVPILILGIGWLVQHASSDKKSGAGSDMQGAEATALRIQPIGMVSIKAAGGGATAQTGEEVFKARCGGCHAAGALGSPKFGDAGAWGPRISQGFEALLNSALKGKNNMPAQGGGDLSDFEIARGVVYMANAGGAKFAEPKAPAGAASGPEGAASK